MKHYGNKKYKSIYEKKRNIEIIQTNNTKIFVQLLKIMIKE